jgi:hypothetical protein
MANSSNPHYIAFEMLRGKGVEEGGAEVPFDGEK